MTDTNPAISDLSPMLPSLWLMGLNNMLDNVASWTMIMVFMARGYLL